MLARKVQPKSDNTENANFIRETFHRRECIRFLATDSVRKCCCERIPNTERSTPDSPIRKAANLPIAESICRCFSSKTTHSDKADGSVMSCNSSKARSVEEDTDTFDSPTNAPAIVDTTEDDKSSNKSTIERFTLLDYKDDPGQVKELFRKDWEMKSPNIFMSIISSGQDETKNSCNVQEFCDKLVEAATQTNAWTITDGAIEGIFGIDGGKIEKSLNENGKTPNVVLSNWGCISDNDRSMKNNERRSHLVTHAICNECGGSFEEKEDSIDRSHTTYVLVDNDRQVNPGLERTFREKLEKELREYQCKIKDKHSSTGDSTPFVYFLIGGFTNDIGSVVRALTDEKPVIVAKGTGGAADRIAKIVEQDEAEIVMDGELATTSRDCLLRGCYNNELLVLFDCNSEQDGSKDLSLCILNALKVKKSSATKTFLLAADWNHKAFAQNHPRKGIHLKDATYECLMKDQFTYVDILLSKHREVKLENLLKRIMKLHSEIILNVGMEEKTDHYFSKQLTPEKQHFFSTEIENKIASRTCIFLWIWNDYRGQTEMANMFWRAGKHYLAMALTAYKISRDLKKEWKGKEEAIAMADQKKKFKALATGFLSTCDKNNRLNTFALLRGPVKDLDDQTPMQIAFDCEFKEFVAQTSFQKLLDKFWAKRIIDYNKNFYFPLIVSIFIPFAASNLFEYRKDEKHRKNLDKHSPTMQSFLCFIRRFGSFLHAPLVKFIYNTLTYIAYLVLFSIVMLTDFQVNMSLSEIALTIWTSILIIEECRQAAIFRSEYLNTWNLFDVIALTLYVLGFILRIIYQSIPSVCLECLYVARTVLCISLLLSVLRVLQLLSINNILGPKIYMIRGLLKDMISFMLIITIFISAYGIVSNAILYPNQPLNAKLLQDVFYDAWWSFLQQFNTDDALGLNCNMDAPSPTVSVEYCSSRTDPYVDYVACKERRCPANTWLVSVLLAFYALFMVIMMVNVLIAMFNVTFEKVKAKQHRVSKMQRYRIIREYHLRSTIPAPLCAFVYLKNVLCCFGLCKCCGCTEAKECVGSSQNLFSKPLVPSVTKWEEDMRNAYEENTRNLQENTIASMVPVSDDDEREGEYDVVLNNPSYVDKKIQHTLNEVKLLLLNNFHRPYDSDVNYGKKDGDSGVQKEKPSNPDSIDGTKQQTSKATTSDAHKNADSIDGTKQQTSKAATSDAHKNSDSKNGSTQQTLGAATSKQQASKATTSGAHKRSTCDVTKAAIAALAASKVRNVIQPLRRRTQYRHGSKKVISRISTLETLRPPLPPKRLPSRRVRNASTQTDDKKDNKDKKGCIYKDCCYEMNIQQDNKQRQGRRMKQKSIAVKAYPGRSYLKKITCSPSSGCKLVINCKDGKVIKLKTPFAEYGVPLRSSEFPAYRLPLSNIQKIHCKCKNLSGGCVCDEISTSGKKAVLSIRMPYGGVVIPPKAGDEKQILFNHKYHRGRSVPVTLTKSPPQAESVQQKDINKWMRPRGDTLTFLPSTSTNPEVSRRESTHRRLQVEDDQ